jgi:hypothetical protein
MAISWLWLPRGRGSSNNKKNEEEEEQQQQARITSCSSCALPPLSSQTQVTHTQSPNLGAAVRSTQELASRASVDAQERERARTRAPSSNRCFRAPASGAPISPSLARARQEGQETRAASASGWPAREEGSSSRMVSYRGSGVTPPRLRPKRARRSSPSPHAPPPPPPPKKTEPPHAPAKG